MNIKSDSLKKLKTYSKDDIIEALGHCYNSDFIISSILNELESKGIQKLINSHDKAYDNLLIAIEAYFKWQNDMCVKYGDGKTVKLKDIPLQEISRGAVLEKALKSAAEKEKNLNSKLNKMLEV